MNSSFKYYLTKTFYNNGELIVVNGNFKPLVEKALKIHLIDQDQELTFFIEKVIMFASVSLKKTQRLSVVINNYKSYKKIILTISANLNFKISIDLNADRESLFKGYIVRESDNNANFHGILEDLDNLELMLDNYLIKSEQVNWSFKDDELYLPEPDVDVKKVLSKLDEIKAYPKTILNFKVSNDCNCNKELYIKKLKNLDKDAIDYIFADGQIVDIDCDWCKKKYEINLKEI